MTPPALTTKSGKIKTPRASRIASASVVHGMLAPSATIFAFNLPALSLVSTSGRAAGIQISQGTSIIASVGAFVPWGESVTDWPVSFSAINPATSRPSEHDTVPRLSLAATSTHPFCARNRAACLPTAPKPCTATLALFRSRPMAFAPTATAAARPKPVAPSSSTGIPPTSRGKPTARPISSCTHPIASSSVPMSGPGMYS